MRSELVTSALKQVQSRYLLTRLTTTAIRAFHRPNTRIADTANQALLRFSLNDLMACGPKPLSEKTVELRRAT
jgi:hypothetical protein